MKNILNKFWVKNINLSEKNVKYVLLAKKISAVKRFFNISHLLSTKLQKSKVFYIEFTLNSKPLIWKISFKVTKYSVWYKYLKKIKLIKNTNCI